MLKTYVGDLGLGRMEQGGFYVAVHENKKFANWLDPKPSQDIINHSPNGFNWGYTGSGPAQLALALLYDITKNKDLSLRYYQDFKFQIIASFGDTWKLEEADILNWIKLRENN